MAKSSQYSWTVLTVALAILAPGRPANAQRAAGPFADILGAVTDPDASQSLVFRGSAFGGWFDTLSTSTELQPQPESVDDRFLLSGGAAGVSGSLTHAMRFPRLQWQSSAASSVLLFGSGDDVTAATFSGDTSVSGPVSRRVSLSGAGRISYSPFYDFAPSMDTRLTNVGAFNGGFGVATEAERNLFTSGSGSMNVRLSRRDTFDAGVSVSHYEFLDQDETSTSTLGAFGRFNHTMTKSLSLHAGFARTEASYEGMDSATSNTIDFGISYNDTLMFTRRTALSFGASTSAVRWESGTHYRVNGTAALTHGFGRSGSAALSYQRGTEFDPAFREPVLTDTLSVGVNNQLGRRAGWSAQAGYTRGDIGFDSNAGSYNSVSAGAGVSVALTRHLGMYTDYSIYRYEVPVGATVFETMPRYARQSVSVGLSLWAPLISER